MTELNAWDNARFGKGEGKLYMDFIVEFLLVISEKRLSFSTAFHRMGT